MHTLEELTEIRLDLAIIRLAVGLMALRLTYTESLTLLNASLTSFLDASIRLCLVL